MLKVYFTKAGKIVINTTLIYNFFKQFIIRALTGVSVKLLKKANYLAVKLLNIADCNSNDHTQLYFFNLLMDELVLINNLERLRIYKTTATTINFNPQQDKIVK